ncbi:MAG: eukaryotic-like serine/threonine-protein kinase, partial [Actinomycetota bacterium]|nr:eukaryotic-like serine/threonine-protein kinase [Actinomycetota bacterium]
MGPLTLTDPESIDGYRLLGRLGAGAMGVVYDAISATGARVALKTLDLATIAPIDIDERLERFAREAGALQRVKGESLVRVLAANPSQEQPYLVTALVEGRTLAEHLQATVMPTDQVALLGMVLAEGLAEVHAEGLIHRDVKPANVILGAGGPVLVDFGLVAEADRETRTTRTGALIGTPLTMAPEQADGQGAGPASDVHGLGAVLVQACTGHPPYGSSGSVQAMLAKIASEQVLPDLSGAPQELIELIRQMLAHHQADRPAAP